MLFTRPSCQAQSFSTTSVMLPLGECRLSYLSVHVTGKVKQLYNACRYLLCSPFLYNCFSSFNFFLFFPTIIPFFGKTLSISTGSESTLQESSSIEATYIHRLTSPIDSNFCLKHYSNVCERCSSTPLPGVRLRYHPGSRVSTAPAYEVRRVTIPAGQRSALAWCSRPGH